MTFKSIPSKSKLSSTTILIEATTHAGKSRGTGFMFAFKPDPQTAIPLLITNKHVIKDAQSVKLRISTSDPSDSSRRIGVAEYSITSDLSDLIINHPSNKVDLAAIAMAPILNDLTSREMQGYGTMFSEEDIITDEGLHALEAAEPILMTGYPTGLADYIHNLPITRQGVIASDPTLPFNGDDQFLIDCACFPGSSGSPVVLKPTNTIIETSSGIRFEKRRSLLIGVLWGGPTYTAEGSIVVKSIPTTTLPVPQVSQMINLGYVISAKKILDLKEFFLSAPPPNQPILTFSHTLI